MDESLARERAAHEYVKSLQNQEDTPFKDTLAAYEQYRRAVQDAVFANFTDAERLETKLWQQHTETRQILARTLKNLRKMKELKAVEIRYAMEMYLRFIKQSTRFYRGYIYQLSTHFGGIPALEAAAQQVKPNAMHETGTSVSLSPELHQQVLVSCHRTLVYLGDLCRYRATDNLDAQQDFGPAIGFYGLACSMRPESGWGYHQQGVVALEQKDHLRAVYNLYRSFLVTEPVVMAKKNLMVQFDRANTAWDKGELIVKGSPNDSAAGEKALVGWFIRLHSMCVKGEVFRGYEELLRELLGRLKQEIQQHALDTKLRRMTFVNISTQYTAMNNYRENQNDQNEQAFYYSLHINILTFTTLLEMLLVELARIAKDPGMAGADLPMKVTPIMTRILPALKLYSSWLWLNTHLVLGLASNDFLAAAMQKFWQVYAQSLDLVSAVFPIWDLEDCTQLTYILEEDAETIGFLPLQAQADGPTRKMLCDDGVRKPRYSDAEVHRLTETEENLGRIFDFLEAGSFVANNIDDTPIHIRGTRFVLGADTEPPALLRPPTPPPVERPKPLSYAAVAVKGQKTVKPTNLVSKVEQTAHAAQLAQMVDSLVDDEDIDSPITPPQLPAIHAAMLNSHNDISQLGITPEVKSGYGLIASPSTTIVPATMLARDDIRSTRSRRKEDLSDFSPRPKLAADRVASLWSPPTNSGAGLSPSNSNSNLNSPAQLGRKIHQRGGSSTSMRSVDSPRLDQSWSSVDSAARPMHFAKESFSNGIAASSALQQGLATEVSDHGMSSPTQNGDQSTRSLLFGSGDSIWSTSPNAGPRADLGG